MPFNQLTTSQGLAANADLAFPVDPGNIVNQAMSQLGVIGMNATAGQTHETAQDGDMVTVGTAKWERAADVQVDSKIMKGSADAYAHILENPKLPNATGAASGAADWYNKASAAFLEAGGTADSGVKYVNSTSSAEVNPTAGGIIHTGSTTTVGDTVQGGSQGEAALEISKLLEGGVFKDFGEVEKSLKDFAATQEGQFTLDAWKDYVSQKHPEAVKKMEAQIAKLKEMKILLAKLKKLAEDEKKSKAKKEDEGIDKILSAVGMRGNSEAKSMLKRGTAGKNSDFRKKLESYKEQSPKVYEQIVAQLIKSGVNLPKVQDFIYQGGSKGGVITPIHSGDDFLGMRDRGSVDNALARNSRGGGTGTINVNVYSNNLEEVKRAIYTAARNVGVGGRKVNRAGTGNFGTKKA